MNKQKIIIWNREFELEIKYDCYTNEELLETQINAVNEIIVNINSINISLEQVKKYCLEQNKKEIKDENIENIFKYVMPKYLYVPRDVDKRVIAIMCNYKFDLENGIAIVFENEKLVKVGKQGTIL